MIALSFLLRLFIVAWRIAPNPDGTGPLSSRPSLVRIALSLKLF